MFVITLLSALLAVQQATAPADLPPAPAPATDKDWTELPRIYVTDSSAALRVEVEHPMQPICMRKPVLGSRVKAHTVCQDQTAWKAYQLAREADADEWADEGKGKPIID